MSRVSNKAQGGPFGSQSDSRSGNQNSVEVNLKCAEASVVLLWVKPTSAMPACHSSAGSSSNSTVANPAPCYCAWEGIRRWPKCLSSCHPCGRSRWSSRLLASAWPKPCHCSHLRSKPEDGKFISAPCFSLFLSLSMLFNQINFTKK